MTDLRKTGVTGAEICAHIEESKTSGALRALADSGYSAADVVSPSVVMNNPAAPDQPGV